MASTLTTPVHHAHAHDAAAASAPLFDTMRSVLECRTRHRPVPGHLVDELRGRQLATLVEAIERYNARMGVTAVSA